MGPSNAWTTRGGPGASSPHDSALHGWVDWAEWVEPVARSLAAVSSSALGDRISRRFGGPVEPAITHVIVVVDVGRPGDRDAASHAARIATMVELRSHFPCVDAVAALSTTRYAVLARRHPGLSGTLTSLEGRLYDDRGGLETLARVWCEELPDRVEDVRAFVRGLRLKAAPLRQEERGTLAAGLPVEILAGRSAPEATRAPRGQTAKWSVRSAAAALVTTIAMSGAGAAAAVGVAHIRPAFGWGAPAAVVQASPTAGTATSAASGGDLFSMLVPGLSPGLLADLSALLDGAAGEPLRAEAAASDDPAPTRSLAVPPPAQPPAGDDVAGAASPGVPAPPAVAPPDAAPPSIPEVPSTEPAPPPAPAEPDGLLRTLLPVVFGVVPTPPEAPAAP